MVLVSLVSSYSFDLLGYCSRKQMQDSSNRRSLFCGLRPGQHVRVLDSTYVLSFYFNLCLPRLFDADGDFIRNTMHTIGEHIFLLRQLTQPLLIVVPIKKLKAPVLSLPPFGLVVHSSNASWSPAGESHILRCSSVVTVVQYSSIAIKYTVFDSGSTSHCRQFHILKRFPIPLSTPIRVSVLARLNAKARTRVLAEPGHCRRHPADAGGRCERGKTDHKERPRLVAI